MALSHQDNVYAPDIYPFMMVDLALNDSIEPLCFLEWNHNNGLESLDSLKLYLITILR